jgi:hypothetical protein
MAILVLSAAVVFLLQGRQEVLDAADTAATDVAALESTRVQLEANLGAEAAALATNQALLSTREAEYASLEGQLIESDQALAAATAALATALAPTSVAAEALEPPTIEILSPQMDDAFQLDDSVPIAFTVYHPAGLSAVQLLVETVAERQELETPPVSGEPYQRFDADYSLDAAVFDVTQSLVISVVATSTLNVANESESVTITVSVPAPEPTATPSASPAAPTTPTTAPPTSTPTGAIDSPAWLAGLPVLIQPDHFNHRRLPGIERV